MMINQKLIGELIGLARATDGNEHLITPASTSVIVACLSVNEDMSEEMLHEFLNRVEDQKRKMIPDCYLCAAPCGKNNAFDMDRLQNENPEIRTMKLAILNGICKLVRSERLMNREEELLLYQALILIGTEDPSETILHKYQIKIQSYID